MATGLAILHKMRIIITAMLQTWVNVLTKPGEKVFAAERSKSSATLSTALAWIFLASVMAALLGLLWTKLEAMWVMPSVELDWFYADVFEDDVFRLTSMIGEARAQFVNTRLMAVREVTGWFSYLWLHSGSFDDFIGRQVWLLTRFLMAESMLEWSLRTSRILLSPLFFLVSVGIYHFIATLLGGQGQVGRYAYLVATFGAPITILKSLLGFIPLVGASAAAFLPGASVLVVTIWYHAFELFVAVGIPVILSVYWLALTYVATKVEHGLTGGRVIVSVAASSLLVFVIRNSIQYAFWGLFAGSNLLGSDHVALFDIIP